MDGIFAIWYLVPSRSMADRMLEEWEMFYLKSRGSYLKSKILCVTELDRFLKDPMNAVIRDNKGEVKISDWWDFKIETNQKNADHQVDQSLIENTKPNSETA